MSVMIMIDGSVKCNRKFGFELHVTSELMRECLNIFATGCSPQLFCLQNYKRVLQCMRTELYRIKEF